MLNVCILVGEGETILVIQGELAEPSFSLPEEDEELLLDSWLEDN